MNQERNIFFLVEDAIHGIGNNDDIHSTPHHLFSHIPATHLSSQCCYYSSYLLR